MSADGATSFSEFDDVPNPSDTRKATPMRWPTVAEMPEAGIKTHSHSHTDEDHHIGECDAACKLGVRAHLHRVRVPQSAIGTMAIYRSERLSRQIREARGLPPTEATGYVPPELP